LELTAESPPWEPDTNHFQVQEAAMLDSGGQLMDKPINWKHKKVIAVLHTVPQYETPENLLGEAQCEIKAVTSSKQGYAIGPDILARNWGIGLSAAKRMLEATTQSGVRTILNSTLSRRFRTNDRQLRYRRIAHEVFIDTLETSVSSWHRQNRYAQVFATSFGWIRVYPMKRKSDAHEGLSLMAQRDGAPRSIIMDGSKEQTLGVFRKKAREMVVHIKQTEPYSPWQNAAEGAIWELKRCAGRKPSQALGPLLETGGLHQVSYCIGYL
jgi:hypothetical protein